MIHWIYHLTAALLILGFSYQIQAFCNIAAGLMLGMAFASWENQKECIDLEKQ